MGKEAVRQWLKTAFTTFGGKAKQSQRTWNYATLKCIFKDMIPWSVMKAPRLMLLPKEATLSQDKQAVDATQPIRLPIDMPNPLITKTLPVILELPKTVGASKTCTAAAATAVANTSASGIGAVNTTTALQLKPLKGSERSISRYANHPLRIRDGVLGRNMYFKQNQPKK